MDHTLETEPVTLSETIDLASWNRPRSDQELRDFVDSRHSLLPDIEAI